jgi:hypothetical protein
MTALVDYRGLQVVSPDPTGDGGLAIQDNFKSLVDWNPKGVWNQSAAPTGTDDNTLEYFPGSLWLRTDTTPSQLFVCKSSATAAASWLPIILNIVQDTSPKLGGDLDVNGHKIIDASAVTIAVSGNSIATATSTAVQIQGNTLIGTTTTPSGATFNIAVGGGPTSPVLGVATLDMVSLAAVDKAAADRRLYIQSEAGSPISIGNDRLNFAASTGLVSVAGTDFVTMTSTLMTLGINANSDSTQLLISNTNATGGSGLRINRSSNVRQAALIFSLSGTAEWYVGEMRRGGSANTTFTIGSGSDVNTTAPLLAVATSGLVGLGVLVPSFSLSFEGTGQKSIGVERNTIAASAGSSMVHFGGSATLLSTDKNGGDFIGQGGVSTGTGSSNVIFRAARAATSTGSSDNTVIEIARFTGLGANQLHGLTAVPTGATYNYVLGGGSATPVLANATTDAVCLAAVDRTAGDRRLYIQSEAGSAISVGNDRVNFAASTGGLSVAGTDSLSLTTTGVTIPGTLAVNGSVVLGDAVGDTVTQNALITNVPNGIYFQKIAETGIAETIARFAVSDDTSVLAISNATNSAGVFAPTVTGTQSGTAPAVNIVGVGTTDTGGNALVNFTAYKLGGTAITTRPLFMFVSVNTGVLSVTAGYNLQFLGGATTPVLNVAATDTVSVAAVDKAAGDRRFYLQSELGSPISLGNDRLNFAASNGVLSIGGADIIGLSSSGATLSDAMNIAIGSTIGTKIGTSTSQKIGFWNASPVVQFATTGISAGFSAGTGTAVNSVSTFTGNVGSSAYTIGDIVAALKKCGMMAS